MAKTILLVEDDEVIRENYAELLRDEGFEVAVCACREQAIRQLQEQLPDIILLDIGLNGEREGGFDLCLDIRHRWPRLPVLFLTSLGSEVDKISGFRLGADDYLTKDVSFDYLLVRIEALLKRYQVLQQPEEPSEMVSSSMSESPLWIDTERQMIFWKQQYVELSLTQFWIVQELIHHAGQIRTYQQLMHAANIVVEPNTITAHIKMIRQQFKVMEPNFNSIRSVRGMGYRWLDEAQSVSVCPATLGQSHD